MCRECNKSICPSGCPNAPEETPVDSCGHCNTYIYPGDIYYDIDDEIMCDECLQKHKRRAE